MKRSLGTAAALGVAALLILGTITGCFQMFGIDVVDLTVCVLDADTDEPIPGAIVTVDSLSATTGGSGCCTFSALVSGVYAITAAAEGYLPYASAATDVDPDEAVEEITIKLEKVKIASGEIVGVVTCSLGLGQPFIPIYVDGVQVTQTDATGYFSCTVSAGDHTVTAGTATGTGIASQSVTVVDGGMHPVILIFDI